MNHSRMLRLAARARLPLMFVLALGLGSAIAVAASGGPPPDPSGPPSLEGQPTIATMDVTPTVEAAKSYVLTSIVNNPAAENVAPADLAATRVLATLPASAGSLAGLRVYSTPTSDGGACVTALNAVSCGTAPDDAIPAKGLGLLVPGAPLVFIGTEAASVLDHVITCDGVSQDVTRNAGGSAFLYTSPAADTPSESCSQTFTLRSGKVVTTPV